MNAGMNFGDSGLRQSALLLHALPLKDRDWILRGLSDSHRESLSGLLAELKELGMPSDPSLLRQVVKNKGGEFDGGGGKIYGFDAFSLRNDATEYEKKIEILRFADLTLLSRVLQGEPDLLIVRFLRLHAWPWEAELLQRLPALKQRDVADLLAKPRWSGAVPEASQAGESRLNAVLLASVVKSLAALESAFASDRSASAFSLPETARGFRKFRQKLRSAFGR